MKGVDHQPRVVLELGSGGTDQVGDGAFEDEYRMGALGSQPVAGPDEPLPTSGGQQVPGQLHEVLLPLDQDPGLEAFQGVVPGW